MAAITNVGGNCLSCKTGKAEYRSLVPLVVKDKVLEPHTYAVCTACFKAQWNDVNSEAAGMNYDEFVAEKAKHYDERGRRVK